MSPEYKAIHENVKNTLKQSGLSEMEKYSLVTTCLVEVANEYNIGDFTLIKAKLAHLCKTMLDAVEAAEKLFGKHEFK